MTTICVKCVYHCGASPDAVWYDHYCLCPTVKRPKEFDPVTGKFVTDNIYPHCRAINNGNCEHFKGGIDVLI